MKLSSHDLLKRRFIAFVILQAALLCLAIFLSINYFGSDILARREGVGLILASPKEAAGWPQEMYQGLQKACNQRGYNLYIEDNVNSSDNSLPQVTDKLIKKGVKKIFLANPGYQHDLETIARKYPQIDFYANSVGEAISDQIFNYSVRYYEVRYLAGILAGLHTQTGIVGYLAPFPALETRRDVNAFALGVKKVRPDARILVQWTGQWISPEKENQALYILKHEGADVVTYFAASQQLAQTAASLGLDYIDFHGGGLKLPPHCLAAIETDWQKVYDKLLRIDVKKNTTKVFWQGMLDDVITLRLVPGLSPQEEAMVIRTRQELEKGYHVFSGEIIDREGHVRCTEGEVIAHNSLREKMDWLVKGVEIIEAK
ncbi:putative membrane lipoprotein [Selenomonas ruminantium subsp. lactilytica TAM6421]|uniref:Putative membrane lipoprotein n=1 Tax=Selenomonas ruminantium subsp. lactilytica (strain NBRC 103574 / TAM6421) TaxID=927704 RepID=I0GUI2_SELRL|nr:BMP family ABC transporter substrate-binding protein [Selenomonas ruminantium]BAL84419.1 putative membrane lipoprotein [Selenomonas ruminantium subsp. lactilytica TAM6421]